MANGTQFGSLGFSASRATTGVHDDVWARVITLEQGVSYAIVGYDLVDFFHLMS